MDCCDWTGKTIFQSAGGRVVPAGNPVFDNIAALSAFRVDPSQNGLVVWVLSVLDAFVYENSSDDTEDGITVVLPAAGSIGRWIRLQIPNEHWARQATWFINVNGNDENSGQTDSSPIKSHAELARRIKGLMLHQPTTVTLQSSLPEVLRLDVTLAADSPPASLTYNGLQRTPLLRASGTISEVQPINIAGDSTVNPAIPANTPLSFADSTLSDRWDNGGPSDSTLIGHRIRITNSANPSSVGAVAWLAQQDASSAKRVRCSPFVLGSTPVTPANGDQYVVEDLMTVDGFDLMLRRRGRGEPVCVIQNLALTRADPVYNSRFASDGAEARYIVTGCLVQANLLEMDRGNFEGSRFQAGSSGRIVLRGASVNVIAGLLLINGYVIETPSALFFSGNHLVQGNGDLGMVVRAPVVELNGVAFFDCNPALVVHHGGAIRVGFEHSDGRTALWGAGNGAAPTSSEPAAPSVVIEPGAVVVYDSPSTSAGTTPDGVPLIKAVEDGIDFAVGGVSVPDEQTAPFFNTANGAGLVNRNGSGS